MPRKKEFEIDDVIEKAMNLFWLNGYNATSMQNLVDHLGINRASIYDTFGSKKSLYALAIDKYKSEKLSEAKGLLLEYSNIRQGLSALFEFFLESDRQPGCFIANAMTEVKINDIELIVALNEYKSAFEKVLYDYLSYGVENSQISPYKNLEEISSYLYIFQNGLKTTSRIASKQLDMKTTIGSALKILN